MSDAPEFSRPVRSDTLGPEPRPIEIAATKEERAALARRFGLVSIARLEARAALSRVGDTAVAEGTLEADVAQSCIGTGEPVEERVAEPFRIEFRPHPQVMGDEEIELSESELDVVFYDGALVDLGEAIAQTLSLSLDPYPRSPKAAAALKKAGVKAEEEAARESSPFAGLAALKDKLAR